MNFIKHLVYGRVLLAVAAYVMLLIGLGETTAETTPKPFLLACPAPSTNAALHYNRGILTLAAIPMSDRELLAKPIWETFGDSSREEIDAAVSKLVFDTRHALRAALKGTDQRQCDFGIDYCDFGHGASLPHVQMMLQLGRLITMAGIDAQIDGDQERALEMFFAALRMGRHLAEQPTLLESLVAIEILENAYYSLAFWATRCEDTALIDLAATRLELYSRDELSPAESLAYEASITNSRLDRLIQEYPDGNWAEMLLETWGAYAHGETKSQLDEKAKAIATERGLPSEIFQDKASFVEKVNKFRELKTNYYGDAARCVALPCVERAARAAEIFAKHQPMFEKMGDTEMLDIRQIGSYFATHVAELTMARVALAAASAKQDGKFPPSLETIKARFGGTVPVSPYDGSPVEYRTLNDGKDISIVVPESELSGTIMPRIEFSSVREQANP